MAEEDDDPVSALRAIVGLSREACAAMLSRAGGDVETAVNRHFDPRGSALVSSGTATSPRASSSPARRSSAPASAQRDLRAFLAPKSASGEEEPRARERERVVSRADEDAPPARTTTTTTTTTTTRGVIPPLANRVLALHTAAARGDAGPPGSTRPRESVDAPSVAPLPYLALATALDACASTRGRIAKHTILRDLFATVLAPRTSLEDAIACAYLAFGRAWPSHVDERNLGVGGAAMLSAVAEVSGASKKTIRDALAEAGDVGDVAAAFKKTQVTLVAPAPLTCAGVLKTLREISRASGRGSEARRRKMTVYLLASSRGSETRWIARTLARNMRCGANRLSVLHAMGDAAKAKASSESPGVDTREVMRRCYGLCPSLEVLIPALKLGGVDAAIQRCRLVPGIPAKPMLASISTGAEDATRRAMVAGGEAGGAGEAGGEAGGGWGEAGDAPPEAPRGGADGAGPDETGDGDGDGDGVGDAAAFLAEFKYDGVRAQIHLIPPNSNGDPTDGAESNGVYGGASAEGGGREGRAERSSSEVPDGGDADADTPSGWRVKIFSRNCEDRTEAFPDVVSAFLDAARGGTGFTGGGGLAIDAEIVGIDRETGKLLPFQDLSRRPRKDAAFDAAAGGDRKNIVHTCVFVFDILLSGDEDALGPGGARTHDLTLRSRRARLDAALPGVASGSFAGKFEYARSIEIRPLASGEGADDPAERAIASVRAFTLEALSAACEGVVLKRLDGGSSYVPGERRDGWIKLKKDYEASLRDSLDLVPIGAWRGNGRKAKWFSPFLLATYDAETGTYQSLCRCMSGFTDAFYAEKTAFYGGFLDDAPGPADEAAEDPKTARGTKKKPRNYDTLETPDVWFDPPREVWEIRGADLTVSPKHRACAGRRHETRGLGLRFPRFIRAREDKSPGDLDAVAGGGPSGPEDVLALFDAQVRRFQGQEREAGKRKRAMTALEEAGAGEEDDEDEDEDEEEEEEEEENGARGAR